MIPIVERQLDGQEMLRVHPYLPPLRIIPSSLVGVTDKRYMIRLVVYHFVRALRGESHLALLPAPLILALKERNSFLQTYLEDRMVCILGGQGARRLQFQAQKPEQSARVDENLIIILAFDVDDDAPGMRFVPGHIDFEGRLKAQLDGLQR